MSRKPLDIVVSGPDMSGTSTQIQDIIDYFLAKGLRVRDLRGTELDALFHAEAFQQLNQHYRSLASFEEDVRAMQRQGLLLDFYRRARTLPKASCVKNNCSSFINPDSADVWILEEPTYRTPLRLVDLNMSQFWSVHNPAAQSSSYAADRYWEFFRFRQALLKAGKKVARSRSEESATYQVQDEKLLPNGLPLKQYVRLPGNALGLQYAPTDIFAVHAPLDWTEHEYRLLKEQRSNGRALDDHEMNVPYQLLVNSRYASDWLENLYAVAGSSPRIHRIGMYDEHHQPSSKEYIREIIHRTLDGIILSDGVRFQ